MVGVLALPLLGGCARGVPSSLASGPHPILVGPISEGIFEHHLARAQSGDLTSIDIVIAYYYNNDMVPEATRWEHFRKVAAEGRFRGKWANYRP